MHKACVNFSSRAGQLALWLPEALDYAAADTVQPLILSALIKQASHNVSDCAAQLLQCFISGTQLGSTQPVIGIEC